MIDHVQYSASKITLHVSLTIYSLDAIKKTCYKFTDQCSIFLKEIKEEEVNLETAFMRLTKGIVQ